MNDQPFEFVLVKDTHDHLALLRLERIDSVYADDEGGWNIQVRNEDTTYDVDEGSAKRLINYLSPRTFDLSQAGTPSNGDWR